MDFPTASFTSYGSRNCVHVLRIVESNCMLAKGNAIRECTQSDISRSEHLSCHMKCFKCVHVPIGLSIIGYHRDIRYSAALGACQMSLTHTQRKWNAISHLKIVSSWLGTPSKTDKNGREFWNDSNSNQPTTFFFKFLRPDCGFFIEFGCFT